MSTRLRRLVAVFVLVGGCGLDLAETSADGGAASLTGCADTWAGYGQAFFAAKCRTCHEHASQYGTQASVQAARSGLTRELSSGAMPQGAALNATEKARILAYLSCGAP